jgi:hypothetical protein
VDQWPPFWHVTLTVAGEPVPEPEIRTGLERLSQEHPFLLSGRYGADRAEVRYWEEAPDVAAVMELALRLWEDHRVSAGLPEWYVVGLEVVNRATFRRRGRAALTPLSLAGVSPF